MQSASTRASLPECLTLAAPSIRGGRISRQPPDRYKLYNLLAVETWAQRIRTARRNLELNVADLSVRTDIPAWTLRSYELGRRRPTRARLLTMLAVLNVDQRSRNEILIGAGFAPDIAQADNPGVARGLTLGEAAAELEQRAWPAMVVNEKIELLAANWLALRLWGIRRARLDDPIARNVLTMATERRIAERCVNWEVAIGGLMSMFKAHKHFAETLEQPSSYFAAVLDRVYAGDPTLVRRFIELWERVPAAYPDKVTWTYPIIWRLPQIGSLDFTCIAHSVNEADGLDIDEWVPANARTFRLLERLDARRTGA